MGKLIAHGIVDGMTSTLQTRDSMSLKELSK